MLRSLDLRGGMPDVVHIHYARNARDVIGGAELERLAQTHPSYRLHLVYTRDGSGAATAHSHFHAAQLAGLCPDWRERDAYAVGPRDLLTALEEHWARSQRLSRLRIERFHAALTPLPADVAGGVVRFGRSARQACSDGRDNLLRLAEAAGLNPPHGCRMGICHSCTTTMVAGRVRDLRTNTVIDEPGTKVQLCVCAAAGDLELDL
jgi:ferredoxin-NADP reductase